MKKILIVDASPRKNGNSDVIAAMLADEIKDAKVEIFKIREHGVQPCFACDYCKKNDVPKCMHRDDMAELIPVIDDCDAIALIAPIYFNQINGPAKTFIDRLYCFFNPTKEGASIASKRGKKAAMISPYGGGPYDVYKAYLDGTVTSFAVTGADEFKTDLYGGVNVPGSIKDDVKYVAAVKEMAKWLAE